MRLGVKVYAISTAPREELLGLQEELGDGVTLLSDPEGEAIDRFGMLDPSSFPGATIARAGTFSIGADGIVRRVWLPEHVHSRPDADDVIDALK